LISLVPICLQLSRKTPDVCLQLSTQFSQDNPHPSGIGGQSKHAVKPRTTDAAEKPRGPKPKGKPRGRPFVGRAVDDEEFRPPEAAQEVQADDPETAVSRIIELVKTRIPKRFGLDPVRDIQVLCPMNRGGVGARSLNIELQAALNPAGDRKVERFGWTFAPGDKVMQIENDYARRSTTATSAPSTTSIPTQVRSLRASTADLSLTDLENSTCWCPRTQRPFTKVRARNTRL
jgi:hypothetical protein